MNKVYLMRRLFNLQMSETGFVFYHINEFNMIVSQLNSVDINFEDEIKALILMSSLPESWDTVVAAISSSRGSEKLKFDEIRDVVLSESIRKREVGDSSSRALSVDRRWYDERPKSTWSIKIKESRKIPEQIKRDLLELWRKRAPSHELYKAKEETASQIWR